MNPLPGLGSGPVVSSSPTTCLSQGTTERALGDDPLVDHLVAGTQDHGDPEGVEADQVVVGVDVDGLDGEPSTGSDPADDRLGFGAEMASRPGHESQRKIVQDE